MFNWRLCTCSCSWGLPQGLCSSGWGSVSSGSHFRWTYFKPVHLWYPDKSPRVPDADASCETHIGRMDLFRVNSPPRVGVLSSPGLIWISVSRCFQIFNAQCVVCLIRNTSEPIKKTGLKCHRKFFWSHSFGDVCYIALMQGLQMMPWSQRYPLLPVVSPWCLPGWL